MCFKTSTLTRGGDNRFEAMESLGKSSGEGETKLKAESESGSEQAGDPAKTGDSAVLKFKAALVAGANFLVGNSLNALPQRASIPNLIMRYLVVSVAIAFFSSLVSLRLHRKKVFTLFRYVSLAFTTSTSAILCYYLCVSPLWSRSINGNR